MQKVVRKVLRAVADYDPDYYDMYADPNEAFFAQLYLARIRSHADAADIRPPAKVLEAGCQAGRLAVPLAKIGFEVTGVDTSGFALRRAREHAKQAGVAATFVQGKVQDVLSDHPDWRFDAVVCAEVLYLCSDYREILRTLVGAVRHGGLLCVSHRPKFYYLLEALRRYDLRSALEVQQRSEGPFRDTAYYNWQTEDELRRLYESLGLTWQALYPIDRFAWLGGLNPAQMTSEQRDQLRELELASTEATSMARYVLVIAAR
ncbi:MAG: methyltransferase domain-containing protein [Candidatus Omnitrophica bacterium]|nr:methyltransferase domain-containing protein [Candidatus Omnitrophota bacterium]